MRVFAERMRWVTRIAAPVLLADVGDRRFGMFGLDLKSGDERIFGVHGDVAGLPLQFKPDCKLHQRASSTNNLGQTFDDVQPTNEAIPEPASLDKILRVPENGACTLMVIKAARALEEAKIYFRAASMQQSTVNAEIGRRA